MQLEEDDELVFIIYPYHNCFMITGLFLCVVVKMERILSMSAIEQLVCLYILHELHSFNFKCLSLYEENEFVHMSFIILVLLIQFHQYLIFLL